ncbi:hypothetical protein [Bacillus cereus]|uniref:hypothetical protein n=1 Tax=Bacillus cereus TaxID=1396 RepID=UPI00119CA607|nr:hypothetical protein [Bacillus cereus]
MVSLDSSLTQIPAQAMLEATLFHMEQHSLLCLKIVSQASNDLCESKEVSFLLYESCWIFHVLIQGITFPQRGRTKQIAQTNQPALPSHILDRIKKIQRLLQKLRQQLCTSHFLDPNQTCSLLLKRLLQQEMFHPKVAKPFHDRRASPPWLHPLLSKKRQEEGQHLAK